MTCFLQACQPIGPSFFAFLLPPRPQITSQQDFRLLSEACDYDRCFTTPSTSHCLQAFQPTLLSHQAPSPGNRPYRAQPSTVAQEMAVYPRRLNGAVIRCGLDPYTGRAIGSAGFVSPVARPALDRRTPERQRPGCAGGGCQIGRAHV